MITFEPLAGRGILFPTDAQAIDATRAGGKAAGLARLHDAGCDVPPWFVITPDCEIEREHDRRSADAAGPVSRPSPLSP